MKKKMGSFAKFVLIMLIGMFVVALLMVVVLVTPKIAHAELVPTIENGVLIVRDIPVVTKVPGVPEELVNANLAYRLVKGEIDEVIIRDEIGKSSYSFALPLIKGRVDYADKMVSYYHGKWSVNPAIGRFAKSSLVGLSILWLWIPALVIAVAIIKSLLSGVKIKELSVPCLVMFAVVIVGTSVGALAGSDAGAITGLVVGLFAGGIVGVFLFGVLGMFLGAIVGACMGMFSGGIAGSQNYEVVGYYCLFLLAVMILSFIISKLMTPVVSLATFINMLIGNLKRGLNDHNC